MRRKSSLIPAATLTADAEVGDFGVVAFFLDGFLRDGAQGLQKAEIRNSKIEKGKKMPALRASLRNSGQAG